MGPGNHFSDLHFPHKGSGFAASGKRRFHIAHASIHNNRHKPTAKAPLYVNQADIGRFKHGVKPSDCSCKRLNFQEGD
jgi:hypothetical protein